MASKETINIDIQTTANIAGIKSVESEIRNLEAEAASVQQKSIFAAEISATQAKQAEDDLAEAIRRRAEAADKARLADTLADAGKSAANGDYLGAAKTIFQNNAAKAIALDAAVVLGSVSAAYVTMTSVFGGVKGQMDELSKSTNKFREDNLLLATTIETLANPFATVGANIKAIWTDVSDWIVGKFDKIVLAGSLASVKNANAAAEMAKQTADSYQKALDAYNAMVEGMRANNVSDLLRKQAEDARLLVIDLQNAQKVADGRAALDASRESRAGASSGDQAADAVSRAVDAKNNALTIAQAAVDAANVNFANALAESVKFAQSDTSAAAASAREATAQANETRAVAEKSLATLAQTQTLEIARRAEEAGATVTADFESTATKIADDLKAKLDAIQSREGANASAALLQSLKGFNEILADDTVSVDEVGKMQTAIDAFRQSNEANSQAVQKGLADSSASLSKAVSIVEIHTSEIAASRARLEALEIQVRGSQNY